MKYLLSRSNLVVIERLARARALLAFDYDGTLAPIVASRDAAGMRRSTLALFKQVCLLYPTAVISGRSRRDVGGRLGGARVRSVIGNHGLEASGRGPEAQGALEEARTALQQLASVSPGLEVEDKGYSLAVHYRQARNHPAARAAVRAVFARLRVPMRIVGGKCVLNVVPASSPHKGDALLELQESQRAEVALFVGDDVTDEDVFRLDQPDRVLTVRVGRSRTSAATYYLRDQGQIDDLLTRLVALRS